MNAHQAILSQYQAALAMLRQAIEKCPTSLWSDTAARNRYWHIAYHALFYTHLYAHTRGEEFEPWEHHRAEYEFLGPKPWPPHDEPAIGEPYGKGEVLAFVEVCQGYIEVQVPPLDLEASSGFSWLPVDKLELQFYNIRHLQHHIGQLLDRLRTRAGIGVSWISHGQS
ncbi:MAG: hypothetical protein ISS56_08730 [Anaerolineae bacterium]|nr:hypothetical protein [Anaerolineae bacterium]